MRFALLLRELEQVERPVDVDLVRGQRRELGARREQRRQVNTQSTSNSASMRSSRVVSVIEPVNSRCTSGASVASSGLTSSVMMPASAAARPAIERVADLAARAGDQNNRFTHR